MKPRAVRGDLHPLHARLLRALFFRSKAAKALSTTPSESVTFAG
jgi:hypothetical protein